MHAPSSREKKNTLLVLPNEFCAVLPSPLFLAAVAAAHSARAARGRAFHIKSAAEPTVGAYAQDGAGAGKPIKSPAPFLSLEEAGVCEARGELSGFVRERPSE